MFYKELINCLRSDAAVAATVSTTRMKVGETLSDVPSIFRDNAPEKTKWPFIVVSISGKPTLDRVIMMQDFNVDYYDDNVSRVKADDGAIAVQNLLDSMTINSEEFSDIRMLLMSGGYIPDTDPRKVHYNSTFSSRGTRKKWMQHISQQ